MDHVVCDYFAERAPLALMSCAGRFYLPHVVDCDLFMGMACMHEPPVVVHVHETEIIHMVAGGSVTYRLRRNKQRRPTGLVTVTASGPRAPETLRDSYAVVHPMLMACGQGPVAFRHVDYALFERVARAEGKPVASEDFGAVQPPPHVAEAMRDALARRPTP